MTKFQIAFFVCLTFSTSSKSQDVNTNIRAPIDRLFLGMAKGDSALVRTAFAEHVALATITNGKQGLPTIRYESGIKQFLKAVGTPHAESWNEPIWDVKVEADGDFAQVWCKYAFFIGKKFSHCGVDAFHLVRSTDGQWRIFHLADTRQKEGCDIPQEIKMKFK